MGLIKQQAIDSGYFDENTKEDEPDVIEMLELPGKLYEAGIITIRQMDRVKRGKNVWVNGVNMNGYQLKKLLEDKIAAERSNNE